MITKQSLKILILPVFIIVFILVFFSVKEIFLAPGYTDEEYRECVKNGDINFAKMHLYGWREAGKYYSRAYEMRKTEKLREKLFLTLFLTAIREKDVKIFRAETYKQIAALGDFPKNRKLQYFSGIIDHYRHAPLVWQGRQVYRAKNRQYVDITLFDIKNDPLDLYLYLFCLDYYTFDFREEDEELIRLLKRHNITELLKKNFQAPLFIFFNIGMAVGKEAEIEKKYPQFAEFFQHRGNMEYEARQLIKASYYYKKALELIPDYTIALNGMGNIYYFTVENYEKAIGFYAKTLNIDSKNPAALFGQAVSLHNLEQYQLSNMVLDYLLSQQKLYHGQAYYYKGYNHYHLGSLTTARELVDRAKSYIPGAGEVNYLSGLLYYKNKETDKAESDFLRTLQDDHYPKGNPLFYLGMINLRAGNWIFFDYFRDSIRSLNNSLAARKRELARIDSLHIQAKLKKWMKWNRTIKLKAFKEASQSMIKQMNLVLDANKGNHSKKGSLQLHLAAVRGKLNKIKLLLAQGANINAKDREGYTALHRAVMMGKKEAAKLLIEAGAAVNTALPGGYTPLHEAAYGGHKEIVEKLIAAGADIYAADSIKKTPVELAYEQGHEGLLDLLKPLHKAVEKGDISAVKKMLDKEPHLLKAVDEKWRTPLYLAAINGYKELARLLIDRGAEFDITERDGFSLLGRLQQKGFKELAEILTARGVVLSDRDMLEKELAAGEAVIWYIKGSGWVIKTRHHVLVFDHLPVRQFWSRRPTLPFISFGEINPNKLHGKGVSVFITHQHKSIPDVSAVISWGRHIKDISYFFGWEPVNFNAQGMNPQTFTMKPGMEKNSSGLEILSVKAVERPAPAASRESAPGSDNNSGVGFLVKVDGLVIYYAGNHENSVEGMWQEYAREIDKVAQREKKIDLLFLTASGAGNSPVNRGAVYALEKLSPGLMFPMHAGCKEYYYKEFAREIRNKKIKTPINYAEKQGQRFIYKAPHAWGSVKPLRGTVK